MTNGSGCFYLLGLSGSCSCGMKGDGKEVKNDLTADEWLVLADFLDKGDRVFDFWKKDKSLAKNKALLRLAQRKFFGVAKELRREDER